MSNAETQNQRTVLLIEDKPADIRTIRDALITSHYRVIEAPTARQAFSYIFKAPPDIIILDINLPDLDGMHLAKELKKNVMLRHIPLVILTNTIDFLEKMKSLDVIVDEYIVRPYQVKDLLVRLDLAYQRVQTSLDANPLTRLPGNNAIVKAIKAKLGKGHPFAVGYVDLNNFKAFNDRYGFSKGDAVIGFTANLIVSILQKLSPKENFVGHVGGDDFIFICSYDQANDVCQVIIDTFNKGVGQFYTEEDKKKGYIVVEDRRGIISQIPLVSIAIGMVSDEGNKFTNLGQINHSLTQLKKYAKSFQGSAYVRDRRTLTNQLAEFTWGPGSKESSGKVLEKITQALTTVMPDQLKDIINKKKIAVLFQPILDMKEDEVMGHESLIRGPFGTPLEFPDTMFQAARAASCVPELDILCMKKILDAASGFRHGIKLFINVFPETLLFSDVIHKEILGDPRVQNLHVIFELSGSHRESDVGNLFTALKQLKNKGQKICIDASLVLATNALRDLLIMAPDYIKLNMIPYKNMAYEQKKQSEFLETVNMIRQVGAEIICTKLESRSDSFLAVKSGVRLGQGYLFARPAVTLSTPS